MCVMALEVSLLLSSYQTLNREDGPVIVRKDEMSELNLTQTDNGKSFEVHRDDVVVIRLKENPSTGYRWAVNKADDRISTSFSLPSDAKVGAGGTRAFTFKAGTVDTAHIQLKHWREWEGDDSIIDRFDITIVVRE